MRDIRWNILGLAVLGALLSGFFVVHGNLGDTVVGVLVGLSVGGVYGLAGSLADAKPDPAPTVPLALVEQIVAKLGDK